MEKTKLTIKHQPRFDLVITNTDRCEVFWTALSSVKNYDTRRDRIIFMDCSRNSQKELSRCLKYIKGLNLDQLNFYFLKRRNWNLNHGAQLDYIRLIGEKKIEKPRFTYFMQEHYLNKKILIKGDSVPNDAIIDLDQIEKLLSKNKKMVFFCARNGFRISASIDDILFYLQYNQQKDINTIHLKNSEDICFVIDGGNFCLDINHYLDHYNKNKRLYSVGNGCINFCGVWEARLCKILYDKKLWFYENSRKLMFRTTGKLKARHPNPGKEWAYFYQRPQAYFLYGKDIYKYQFKLCKEYIREIIMYIYFSLKYNRNKSVKELYPVKRRLL